LFALVLVAPRLIALNETDFYAAFVAGHNLDARRSDPLRLLEHASPIAQPPFSIEPYHLGPGAAHAMEVQRIERLITFEVAVVLRRQPANNEAARARREELVRIRIGPGFRRGRGAGNRTQCKQREPGEERAHCAMVAQCAPPAECPPCVGAASCRYS